MAPPTPRSEFVAGVRAQLPLLLGVSPFGMAYGAYAVKSGLSDALSQAMSVIVFGGASQFVGVRLMAEGVPGAVIVLTTLLVNSRHVLYSASISLHTEHLPRRWRWLLAYLLTDEAYATAITRYRRNEARPHGHWFVLGTGLTLWAAWQFSTAIGVFVGGAVPDSWSLDFALPLTFLAIIVPALTDRASFAAAAVAATIAVAGFRWEYGTGLLTAMLCGVAAGIVVSRSSGTVAGGGAEIEAA
jgi:4-azaleucine resistance transporter AzlC